MPDRPPRTPSYRLHRPSGQAVVTLDGRDVYLGKHGTPASRAEYDRLVGEWLANGRRRPSTGSDVTVAELMVPYLGHVDGYYRKDGRPTSEATLIRLALRELRRLYGHTPARDFGPLALKAVRRAFVEAGLCRTEVNRRTGLVARFFRWASDHEHIPPPVYHGLKAVTALRKGRCDVRESEPVRPVPEAFVEAIRPHVARQVWAMIQLQRLSGMRPGEVCLMRTCDLDTSGRVWAYTPESHKTEHHGKSRVIYLGPRAQAVVRPWLRADLAAYLFSPAEAMEERRAGLRARRRAPVPPSQRRRRKARPRREPGGRYTTQAYQHAIARACRKAGVPGWGPNRLRHNAATWLRKEFGLEVARVVLGHGSPLVTEVYAEADREKALAAMEQVG